MGHQKLDAAWFFREKAFQIFVTILPRWTQLLTRPGKTFAQPQKWMWFCARSHRTPAPGKEHRIRISLHLLISQKSLDVQKTPKTYATIELQLGVTGKIHHRCLQLFLWDFQWSLNNLAHLATTVQRLPSVAAGSSTSAWPADRIKPHPFAVHFFERWPLSKWKDLHPPYASLCAFVPIQLHDKSMNHAPIESLFTALKKIYPLSLGQNPKMFLRFTGFSLKFVAPQMPQLEMHFWRGITC